MRLVRSASYLHLNLNLRWTGSLTPRIVSRLCTAQTFTPISVLPSSSPQAPLVGTVLDYSSYLPVPTNSEGVAIGSAGPNAKKFSRQNGKVAAVGVLLSVLAGALVVL